MAHDLEKKWRSQDVQLKENADFSSLLLNDRILSGLTKAGFKKPSPIQLEAIPLGLFGKDLLVQAKSGTGKTIVFVTVALQMLRSRLFRPQILVLAPTREIATQIESVVKLVGSAFPKLICHSFIGGLSVRDDTEKTTTCQFVVGTPGRIKQLITMKALPTNSIRLLVFDEADQLFHRTFKEEIDAIFKSLPEVKQVIATSATYPPNILKLISQYLSDPSVVCLNAKELALLGIVHYAKVVKFMPMPLTLYNNKLAALEEILKHIKFSQCLVFCNGIHRVEVLYRDIKKWGFSVTYISSKKEQCDRLKAIDKLKHFKCKVLVSSDLTARGIDAENVDLVVNFDLSLNTETYMHRVGRAGRYGAIGVAISIIHENEINNLKKIEDEASFKSYKLPDPVPRDLILNPYFGDYLIPKQDVSDNCKASEIDKNEFVCNGDVVKENLQTNLENTSSEENNVTNGIDKILNEVDSSKINVTEINSKENNLFKTDELSRKEHTNYEMNTLKEHERRIKIESESKGNVETETPNIELAEQIIPDQNKPTTVFSTKQNTENESLSENNIITSDCDSVELITKDNVSNLKQVGEPATNDSFKDIEVSSINASGNMCNSHAESTPKPVESNRIISKPKDVLPNISNEDKLNDKFEKDELDNINKRFKELEIIENVSGLSDNKDTAIVVKDNINFEQINNLKHAIKLFIKKFEKDESLKSISTVEEDKVMKENLSESSETKISESMVRDLCIQKNKFFYNAFKIFDENTNETVFGESRLNKNLDSIKKLSDNFSEQDKCSTNVTDESKNLVENDLLKDLNIEKTENCLGKPNYASTPQTKEKVVENITYENCEPEKKTEKEKKVILFAQHNSSESASSETHSDTDSESSDEVSSVSKHHSSLEDSESISDTDISDSESESENISSDDEQSSTSSHSSPAVSSSSDSCSTDNVYHMLDTGRRNPSLVMNSSDNFIDMREGDTNHVGEQKYQNRHNTRFHHSDKQPKYHVNSRNPHSAGVSSRRHQTYENNYGNIPQNNQEHLACPRHHSLKCFLPSAHRCHPNTIHHICNHRQLCAQWYNEFYSQWHQLQNMLH